MQGNQIASESHSNVDGLKRVLVSSTTLSFLLSLNLPYAVEARFDREQFEAERVNRIDMRNAMHADRDIARNLSHQERFQNFNSPISAVNPATFTQLNLNSSNDVVSLTSNDLLGANSVDLNVGGVSKTFEVGDRVSAAEYVAIKSGSAQSLILDSHGRAEGGSFSLNSLGDAFQSLNVSQLVIPKGVTAIGDLSQDPNLNLNGGLINRGSIYGLSTNSNIQTGSIFADSIKNQQGGLISTVLSQELSSAYNNAINGFGLILNSNKDIENAGQITSAGTLSLIAGGSIINSLGSNIAGAQPVIESARDLNLTAGSGNILNNGMLVSNNGSININALNAQTAINLDSTSGTVSALNGAVNIRSAADLNAGNISINGGDYLTNDLNLYAYQGHIAGSVGELTGDLNTQATTEVFFASTDNLTLGENCVTGDPTFANTSGNIVINGVNTFNQAVAIIANGNITATNGAQINNSGGSVIMIAGAKATTSGGNSSGVPGTPSTSTVAVSFDPAQGAGGNIDLSTGAASTVINTSSSSTSGGNVILAALANSSGNGGSVLLGNNGIDTSNTNQNSSATSANGGNVTIIAGANPNTVQNTITVGAINAGGGSGTNNKNLFAGKGGTVSLLTQQPISPTANSVSINAAGVIINGDIAGSGTVLNNAAITVNGDITTASTSSVFARSGANAGAINISAGSNISTKNLLAYGSGGAGGSATLLSTGTQSKGGDGGAGASISVVSKTGDVLVTGQVNSSGGGGGGGAGKSQVASRSGTKGGVGGVAGDITITSATNLAVIGSVYAVDGGAGGNGGNPKGRAEGGGGGGGGSYGGGGGGGGDAKYGGGGGGGGYFGGGGGSLRTGGGGGRTGGAGGLAGPSGSVDGNPGIANQGGGGASGTGGNGGAGGGLGAGGAGAASAIYGENGGGGNNANSSKSRVNITAGGTVAAFTNILGGDVKIEATQAGGVTLGQVSGFNSVVVKTNTGAITQTAATSINSPNLTLTSATGAIGSAATNLAIGANNLNVSTGSTLGAFLNNSLTVNITNANVANGTFQLHTNGSNGTITTAPNVRIVAKVADIRANTGSINVLTNTGELTVAGAGNVTVNNIGELILNTSSAGVGFTLSNGVVPGVQGSNAIIHLNGNITAGNIVSLSSLASDRGQVSGIIADVAGATLTASNVKLADTGIGHVGESTRSINLNTRNLTVATQGSVYLQNVGNIRILKSTAGYGARVGTSDVFKLVTTPDAANNGTITIGNGTDGGIQVNAPNTPTSNSQIILQSSENPGGIGGIVWAAGSNGLLQASTVSLADGVAGSGNGNIGTAVAPILTKTANLAVNTQASGFINNTGSTNVLDSTLSNAGTFFLKSSGDIDSGIFGTITAANVILSTSGNIGQSASMPALLNASNITLESGGSVFVSDSSANPVSLVAGTVGSTVYHNKATGTFSVVAPNSVNFTNQEVISAAKVIFKAPQFSNQFAIFAKDSIEIEALTQNVSINKPISADFITLTANGTDKTIVQTAEGIISANKNLTINLSNGVANLQTVDNKVAGLSDNVTGDGQVLLRTVSGITLSAISGATQRLTVLYTGSLNATTPFTVGPLTLTPTGVSANNAITIGALVTSNSLATLQASGNGDIKVTGGFVGTGDKTLITATGDISLDGALTGNQITLTTGGGNISQTAKGIITTPAVLIVNLNNAGTANLATAANVVTVFRDNVVGAGSVNFNTINTLVLDSIVGTAQKFTATSGDTIATPNVVEAATLNLTAKGGGGIGSMGSRLRTTANDITLNATNAAGNVFATTSAPGSLTVRASSAGGIFDLIAAQEIKTVGAISGGTISLASGGAGGIIVTENLGTSATNQVTLTTPGAGAIYGDSKATIFGNTINLTSGSGAISAGDLKNPLKVNGANVAINTTGGGLVNVLNTSTAQSNLANSTSGQSFVYETKGALVINNVQTSAGAASSNGSVSITAGSGALIIANGSNITANGGNVLISAEGADASINVGQNVTILGSSTVANIGNVIFNAGKKGAAEVGPTPANVIVNETLGGRVFFGKNGITAGAPNNILNAEGRNISFISDKPNTISLGGGVTITADPPRDFVASFGGYAALSAVSAGASLVNNMSPSTDTSDESRFSTISPSVVPTSQSLASWQSSVQSIQNATDSLYTVAYSAPAQTLTTNNVLTAADELGANGAYQKISSPVSPEGVYRLQLARETNSGLIHADTLVEASEVVFNSDKQSKPKNGVLVGYVDFRGKAPKSEIAKTAMTATVTRLRSGNLFCAPTNATAILDTDFGKVKIAPHAMVLAMAVVDGLAIYNFDDRHHDSVVVEHNNHKLSVSPGHHILITSRNAQAFEEVNVSEHILYSGVKKTSVGSDTNVFTAEFFIPSAIDAITPLKKLVQAKDAASVVKAQRMLKTAAIILHLQGGKGSYQQYFRPRATAWK